MTATYKPRAGSLAAHLVSFFEANPDEELDLDAIATKYDESRGTIHTKLAQAVASELLALVGKDDAAVYRRGAALAPAPTSAGAAIGVVWKGPQEEEEHIDPATVPIDTDVPVPTSRSWAADWSALLDRMKVGHSAQLPIHKRVAVTKAARAAKLSKRGLFLIKKLPDGKHFRVWRTQ